MKKSGIETLYHLFGTLYFSIWFWIFFTTPARAYIDPATTAMVTQIVAGVFISIGVLIGVFRRKIVLFFQNLRIRGMKRKIENQNRKHDSKEG